MSVIGYARVSTRDQQPASQIDRLRAAGAQRVFVDHGQSADPSGAHALTTYVPATSYS